jgi:hypothetical protein
MAVILSSHGQSPESVRILVVWFDSKLGCSIEVASVEAACFVEGRSS